MAEAENKEIYSIDHSKQVVAQPGNKEAVDLWRKVTLQLVSNGGFDLSARQLAILLVIYSDEGNHTVKSLAERLNITKPPICRALDSLSKHNLAKRRVDPEDRRVVYIEPTQAGYDYLAHFSQNIMDKLSEL